MRAYLIDELEPSDAEKIKKYLNDVAVASGLEKIYWLRIPQRLLNEAQMSHRDCQPHVFAVELGNDWVKFEFFSRSSNQMACFCQDYSTESQTAYIINFANQMIDRLGIKT